MVHFRPEYQRLSLQASTQLNTPLHRPKFLNPFPIIFRLSFKSNNLYTMALLKEISRIPLHSEIFKHWEINYGQITPNHQPICHIMIYRLNTRYYIELSGWYTGKHFWSASASSSLLDLYFEVKAVADERTFRSLKDYERREQQ